MATEAQCGQCGETNPADSAFCLFCGTYLGWNERGRAPAPDGQPEEQAPAEPSPPRPPAPSERRDQEGDPEPAPPVRDPAPPPEQRPAAREVAPRLPPCPSCGHPNDPARRFCGRCGQVLVAADLQRPRPRSTPPSGRGGWRGSPQERAARRAYRRSLPPLYRWRRVLVGIGLVALLGAATFFLTGNSLATLGDRWTELTAELREIPEVTAAPEPPDSVAPLYSATSVNDNDPVTAWATAWPEGTEPAPRCGTSGRGTLVLTWSAAAKVEAIEIRAGLSPDVPNQDSVAQPARIDVRIGDACEQVPLDREAGWQRAWLDLDADTTTLTVSVADVYAPRAAPEHLVAISEIRLMTTR